MIMLALDPEPAKRASALPASSFCNLVSSEAMVIWCHVQWKGGSWED